MEFGGFGGWAAVVLATAFVGVLLAGFAGRRLPWRRSRWVAAALGLLVLSLTLPSCGVGDADPPVAACQARVAGFVVTSDSAELHVALATPLSLAAGLAPVLSALLRHRDRLRGAASSDERG